MPSQTMSSPCHSRLPALACTARLQLALCRQALCFHEKLLYKLLEASMLCQG